MASMIKTHLSNLLRRISTALSNLMLSQKPRSSPRSSSTEEEDVVDRTQLRNLGHRYYNAMNSVPHIKKHVEKYEEKFKYVGATLEEAWRSGSGTSRQKGIRRVKECLEDDVFGDLQGKLEECLKELHETHTQVSVTKKKMNASSEFHPLLSLIEEQLNDAMSYVTELTARNNEIQVHVNFIREKAMEVLH